MCSLRRHPLSALKDVSEPERKMVIAAARKRAGSLNPVDETPWSGPVVLIKREDLDAFVAQAETKTCSSCGQVIPKPRKPTP